MFRVIIDVKNFIIKIKQVEPDSDDIVFNTIEELKASFTIQKYLKQGFKMVEE